MSGQGGGTELVEVGSKFKSCKMLKLSAVPQPYCRALTCAFILLSNGQWPEVYDLCHTFFACCLSQKNTAMQE